jgi:penicillin G amidase
MREACPLLFLDAEDPTMRAIFISLLLASTAAVVACDDDTEFPPTEAATTGTGAGTPGADTVDVLRDERGIAQVFGASREAAFYGLGWASAEDRLYQMEFTRRFMRGTMAAIWGAGPGDKVLDHDRRMRVLGFARHAEKVLASPDFPADVHAALDAYAQGVNDRVAKEGFELPSAFAKAGIDAFEPWTAADSLLAWERVRERFNGLDMDAEAEMLRKCGTGSCVDPAECKPPIDEAAAAVPETSPWPPSNETACLQQPARIGKPIVFKASHTWAVAGDHTTTGKPVLAMDPKLGLTAPSMWYAYEIAWPDTEARGIGVAGAPGFLIFWNRDVAQSLTAGGGDIADLFVLTPSGDGSGYVLDGSVKPYDLVSEKIEVEGASAVDLEVKETVFGPVVTSLLEQPGTNELAMRHSELAATGSHSLVGVIELMSATDLASYEKAFEKILTPSANAVFAIADRDDPASHGHIGYALLGSIAERAPNVVQGTDWGGAHPYDGSTLQNDWKGMLDFVERPHVIDPKEGYAFSGNSLPVGSWFDDYAYTGIASVGDTLRSLRLRYRLKELLGAPGSKITPADVHAIHFDARHTAVELYRDVLQYLADQGQLTPVVGPAQTRGEKAAKTLAALDAFMASGGELRHSNPQTPVAHWIEVELVGHFRQGYWPTLVCQYNGAEGGLSFFLKSFDADPDAVMADPVAVDFALTEAANAWDAVSNLGDDPAAWQVPANPPSFEVLYQANQFCPTGAEENCSLDPAHDFDVALDAAFGTILSSHGSSGTATIDFADVEASVQLAPLAAAEDPASPYFQSGLEAWKGEDAGDPASTPAAPLARELVEPTAVSTVSLTYTKP